MVATIDGTTGITATGMAISGPASNAIYALGTTSGTITMNLTNSSNQSVTLNGSSTLANPTNLVAGMAGTVFVSQDSTGSRTLAYGSYWKWPNKAAPALTTTASATDVIVWTAQSTTVIVAQLIPNIG